MKKTFCLLLLLLSQCGPDYVHVSNYGNAVLIDTVTIGVLRCEFDQAFKSDLSGTYQVQKDIHLYLDVFDAKNKRLQKTILLRDNLKEIPCAGGAYYKPNFFFVTSAPDGNVVETYNFETGAITLHAGNGANFKGLSRYGNYYQIGDKFYSINTDECRSYQDKYYTIFYDEKQNIGLYNTGDQYTKRNTIKVDFNTSKEDTIIKGSNLTASLCGFNNYLLILDDIDNQRVFIQIDSLLRGDRNYTPILNNTGLISYADLDPKSGYYAASISNIITYGNIYTSYIDTISQKTTFLY